MVTIGERIDTTEEAVAVPLGPVQESEKVVFDVRLPEERLPPLELTAPRELPLLYNVQEVLFVAVQEIFVDPL